MFLPPDMPIRTDICGSIPNDLRVVTSCDPQEPSGMEKTRTPVRIVVTADGGRSSLAASNGPGHLGNALPPNTQFIAVAAETDNRSYAALQPVNPVVVPDGEPASDDGVHPTTAFVQYVESTGDGIYATANGQIAYPVYTVADGTVFTSNGGAYYTTSGGNSTSSAVTFAPVSGQALTTAVVGNATYLLPHIDSSATEAGQPTTAAVTTNALPHVAVTSAAAVAVMSPSRTSPQTDSTVTFIMTTATNSAGQASDSDASQQSLAHANRVSPVTVQWLMENYETAEGVSLPRSTLYKHYIRHCSENNLDPVNPASFGKLIRSVFIGLRTRRLGTRGNSKYHYYGIRVKPTSPLNELTTMDDEDEDECASPTGAELKSDMKQYHAASSDNVGGNGAGCSKIGRTDHQVCAADMAQSSDVTNKGSCHGHQHPHSHLGEPATPFPAFPAIDFGSITLAKGVSLEDVEVFRALYEENCEGVMTAVVREHFNAVDAVWQQFWKPLREDIGLAAAASHDGAELALELQVGSGSSGDLLDEDSGGGEVDARQLSGAKIYLLCKCPAIQEFVRQADYTFYQYMVNYLIPDVLKPIPSHLTQAIRNFAKNLEGWLSVAMEGAPPEIVHIKLAAVNAFSQMLRRYTSLNHLAQAARAVLHNASQIQQMLNDLNRVDFYHVQEQASWVCDCDRDAVSQIEREFKEALQRQNTLEQWALWLEDVVTRSLARFENAQKFHRAARRFLLNWSFYSSMVIRDLTLRSAASFGSFHLIRLLYDEYMFYLVEHKVAAVTSASPIAIMGDFLADGQTNFANPVIYVSANDAGGNGPVGKRNDACASSASVLEAEPSSSSSPSSVTLVPCLQPAKPDPSECVVFGTKRKLVPANGPVSDDGSVAVVLKQQQQPSMDGHLQENFQLAKRMKSFQ